MFTGLLNLLNVFRRISVAKHFSLKIYLISQNIGHCMLWYHGLDFFLIHLLVVDGLCEYTRVVLSLFVGSFSCFWMCETRPLELRFAGSGEAGTLGEVGNLD